MARIAKASWARVSFARRRSSGRIPRAPPRGCVGPVSHACWADSRASSSPDETRSHVCHSPGATVQRRPFSPAALRRRSESERCVPTNAAATRFTVLELVPVGLVDGRRGPDRGDPAAIRPRGPGAPCGDAVEVVHDAVVLIPLSAGPDSGENLRHVAALTPFTVDRPFRCAEMCSASREEIGRPRREVRGAPCLHSARHLAQWYLIDLLCTSCRRR